MRRLRGSLNNILNVNASALMPCIHAVNTLPQHDLATDNAKNISTVENISFILSMKETIIW